MKAGYRFKMGGEEWMVTSKVAAADGTWRCDGPSCQIAWEGESDGWLTRIFSDGSAKFKDKSGRWVRDPVSSALAKAYADLWLENKRLRGEA